MLCLWPLTFGVWLGYFGNFCANQLSLVIKIVACNDASTGLQHTDNYLSFGHALLYQVILSAEE